MFSLEDVINEVGTKVDDVCYGSPQIGERDYDGDMNYGPTHDRIIFETSPANKPRLDVYGDGQLFRGGDVVNANMTEMQEDADRRFWRSQ